MSTTTTTLATAADYATADRKGKAAIRKAATDAMHAALKSGDLAGAVAAQAAVESYVSTPKSAPVEVDWNQRVADRIAVLGAAIVALQKGDFDGAPDGLTLDLSDVTPADVTPADVAKLTKVTKSARHDLGAMIVEVCDGDFRTVAQIRSAIIEATDGDYVPSDGAIAARLFPKSGACTLTGVEPVDATATTPRGAVAVHVED